MAFYKEFKPCLELQKYIKCFWIMEKEYNEVSGTNEYLWPTGLTEILNINGPNFSYLHKAGEETVLANELLIGAYNQRFVLKNHGKVRIVGIRCFNHGANLLFKIDSNLVKNQIIEFGLKDFDKSLIHNDNNQIVIDYLNEYCKRHISKSDFLDILYQIYSEDNPSIDELSTSAGLSLRQFERKVKQLTSFAPKELLTIIRFDKARLKLLFSGDYLQVMTEMGYYDYSHFSRDFKKFYALTPKQFIDKFSFVGKKMSYLYNTP